MSRGRSMTCVEQLVTYLSESGVPAAQIDRFIGKQVSEGAASHAAYNFAPRLPEKKQVADTWVKFVKELEAR